MGYPYCSYTCMIAAMRLQIQQYLQFCLLKNRNNGHFFLNFSFVERTITRLVLTNKVFFSCISALWVYDKQMAANTRGNMYLRYQITNILEQIGMTNKLVTMSGNRYCKNLLCLARIYCKSIANKPKLLTYVKFECDVNTEDYVILN